MFMSADPQEQLAELSPATPLKLDVEERERATNQQRVLRTIRDKVANKSSHVAKVLIICHDMSHHVMQVFREFDENHDGSLSKQELRSGLTTIGVQLNDQEFDDLIQIVGDEKGNVDYEDFATVFKEPDQYVFILTFPVCSYITQH